MTEATKQRRVISTEQSINSHRVYFHFVIKVAALSRNSDLEFFLNGPSPLKKLRARQFCQVQTRLKTENTCGVESNSALWRYYPSKTKVEKQHLPPSGFFSLPRYARPRLRTRARSGTKELASSGEPGTCYVWDRSPVPSRHSEQEVRCLSSSIRL